MNKIQTRTLVKGLEIREAKDKKYIGTLVGYAAKFDKESRDFGGYVEVIKPGAFKRSLGLTDDLHDVRALFGHDSKMILARRSAGTLEISEDSIGLAVSIHLVDTQLNRDTLTNVRAGNLDSMSFGFLPVKQAWAIGQEKSDPDRRELLDVDLLEVSLVAWGQYDDTEISARDLQEFRTLKAGKQSTPLRLLRLRQAFNKIK